MRAPDAASAARKGRCINYYILLCIAFANFRDCLGDSKLHAFGVASIVSVFGRDFAALFRSSEWSPVETRL